MEVIHVTAVSTDGKLAFAEQNEAHPDGEVTVFGDGEVVKVARTPAVEQAILDGNLYKASLVQVKEPGLPDDTVSATTETVETETFDDDEEEDA